MTGKPTLARTRPERRANLRRDVNLRAIVRLPDGRTLACRVKNISAMGALFELTHHMSLPASFRLSIPDEMFSAECERRHQAENRVGVLFMSSRAEALARFGG